MSKITVVTIAVAAIAFSGIHTFARQAAPQGMTPAQMGNMTQPQACPMKVPNSEVTVADTKDGVALNFSAKSKENITDLRQRVQQMAKMHEAMAGMPGMAGASGMSMAQSHMTPFTSKFEETSNGARLTLTPKDPAQLQNFRKQVAVHVEHMKKGDCSSMMQEMMQGMMPGMMSTTPGTATPQK